MRVLMLTWEFPPRSVGGVAAHVDGLSQALAGRPRRRPVHAVAPRRPRRQHGRWRPCCEPAPTCRGCPTTTSSPASPRPTTTSCSSRRARRLASRHRPRPRLAGRLGRRHARRAVRGQARRHVPRHRTRPARRRVPPGEPSTIHAVESWLAHGRRGRSPTRSSWSARSSTGSSCPPSAPTSSPTASTRRGGRRARSPAAGAARVHLGSVQYEKGFQVLARAMRLLRPACPGIECIIGGAAATSRAAVADRPRGCQRPRPPPRLPPRRPPARHRPPGRLRRHPVAVRAVRHRRPRGAGRRRPARRRPHRRARRADRRHRRRPAVRAGQRRRAGRVHRDGADRPRLADDMRRHGAALLADRYSWTAIAGATASVYARPPRPAEVRAPLAAPRPTLGRAAVTAVSRSVAYLRPPMRPVRRFEVDLRHPRALAAPRLATNLHWSWDAEATRAVRPPLAGLAAGDAHPAEMVRRTTADRLAELAADPGVVNDIGAVSRRLQTALKGATWFAARDGSPLRSVAYFSPEFGISEACRSTPAASACSPATTSRRPPTSACRSSASACSTPRATSASASTPTAGSRRASPTSRPPVARPRRHRRRGHRRPRRRRRQVPRLAGRRRAHPAVPARHRRRRQLPDGVAVTDRLYGGDEHHRLRQEIVLGIGGVRALRALGHRARRVPHQRGPRRVPRPRAHPRARRRGLPFDAAIEAVRGGGVFTTHTPVPAGIDRFPRDLMEPYFTDFAAECGVTFDELFAARRAARRDRRASSTWP